MKGFRFDVTPTQRDFMDKYADVFDDGLYNLDTYDKVCEDMGAIEIVRSTNGNSDWATQVYACLFNLKMECISACKLCKQKDLDKHNQKQLTSR